MARETQKQIIERLEKELWDYKVMVSKLQGEIYDIQYKSEESFTNRGSSNISDKTHAKSLII